MRTNRKGAEAKDGTKGTGSNGKGPTRKGQKAFLVNQPENRVFALFRRKTAASSQEATSQIPKGLLRPKPAATLLATARRQKLLEHIWQRTSLSRGQFADLYRAPIERYALLVQEFPASESHHHAYPGGMLDHGLEVIAYALKLRQSHLLPPGATPETQAAQAEAWTAGVAYAALLHDIGKIAVDLHVEYGDGERWHPWHGAPQHAYRFRYRKDRAYRLHGAAIGLLYTSVLTPSILDWLQGYPELWSALLYVLAGQYEHAGILGEIVTQADQASVTQELGGDPSKARVAPKRALQRKLLEGLRYLVREELKLNQAQASDGWLTQDALWLVSKTVCDKLRAHLLSQGIEGIPENNIRVFSELQDHGIVQATAEGKAIWKATVESEGGWTQTFTFLKLAPALIWDQHEQRSAFTGTVRPESNATQKPQAAGETATVSAASPVSPDRAATPVAVADASDDSVDSLLQLLSQDAALSDDAAPIALAAPKEAHAVETPAPSTAVALPSEEASSRGRFRGDDARGLHFVRWLRKGIETRHLIINDAKALVHTVDGTAYLVTPGLFQRYAREHPLLASLAREHKLSDWEWTQKNFEKLCLHRKQHNGLNIWVCKVAGPRKTKHLNGYLLLDPQEVFSCVPADNPYLKLLS